MGKNILIADGNKRKRSALAGYFRAFGFAAYEAGTREEAVKLAGQYHPDCLLLQRRLSGGGAAAVCVRIRSDEYLKTTLIMVLGGYDAELAAGRNARPPDGFVGKGASRAEIFFAVKSLLRRAPWKRGILKKFNLRLDAGTLRIIKTAGTAIRLPPEQFRLFAMLFERSPDFVTKDEICAHVFPDMPSGKQEALLSLVYCLRRKLGPQLARRIRNKRFRGWLYVQSRLRKKTFHPRPLAGPKASKLRFRKKH